MKDYELVSIINEATKKEIYIDLQTLDHEGLKNLTEEIGFENVLQFLKTKTISTFNYDDIEGIIKITNFYPNCPGYELYDWEVVYQGVFPSVSYHESYEEVSLIQVVKSIIDRKNTILTMKETGVISKLF